MKKPILAVSLLALPATGAQAMDVRTFLAKADALASKGMLALLSSDYGLLKREIETDVRALVGESRAAAAAGRPHTICAPPGGMSLSDDEILASLRNVPVARRPQTDVKEPLRAFLSRKFPCR